MPTIEYTLSFENFLEMTRSRREKKDYKFAVISAITGFFCIAGGYLFLRLGHDSFFPGGLLLASGLLFTFVGMILGLLAKPRSVRPDTRALEREYKLWYGDKRNLGFDETGWRVVWREGEDVRPWSSLRKIYELETLLVLGTEGTYYWFPKDALERAGELENLRSFAEAALLKSERLFEAELKPSIPVYVLARAIYNWRLYLLPKILCLGVLTLVAYWTLVDESSAGSRVPWIFVFVPLLGWLPFEALFFTAKYFGEDWPETSQKVEIMSDRTGYKTKKIRWIVEHKHITDLKKIPGAYMVYFDPRTYVLVPTSDLSKEQKSQFEEVVALQKAQAKKG